jgi:hypothetical protein
MPFMRSLIEIILHGIEDEMRRNVPLEFCKRRHFNEMHVCQKPKGKFFKRFHFYNSID